MKPHRTGLSPWTWTHSLLSLKLPSRSIYKLPKPRRLKMAVLKEDDGTCVP